MNGPRDRWNARYTRETETAAPSSFVTDDLAPFLGEPGSALDVAGGSGRNSLWLAARGWSVTLVDVSDVAIDLATKEAARRRLSLTGSVVDLEEEPLPAGAWGLILVTNYLQRGLMRRLVEVLQPDGLFAFSLATVRNLERHDRPGCEYLLDPGEATTLIAGLEPLHHVEEWSDEQRHEARVVARKPSGDPKGAIGQA